MRHVFGGLAAPRNPVHPLPYLALVFGVLALGWSAIFVKLADAPGPVFGFYRMAIAIAVLALPGILQVRRAAPLPRKNVNLALLGGLFLALDLSFWNDAVLTTSAANAALFGNTSVIWVALGAMLLLKERLRPVFWLGLALTSSGMLIILGQDLLTHPALGFGDLKAILSGFFYALFFLASARVRDRLSAFMTWWMSSLSCAFTLLIVCLALGLPLSGYPLQTYVFIVAAALVTQVGGYLAVNYALGHLPASAVSPTMLGQVLIAALVSVPVLGQTLSVGQIVGGTLVLGGILVVHYSHQVRQPARA